ncbi:MAG: hypothetical protein F4034_04545 [Chloroflexi bacterium]|nr:hypothetical protein [Chloroflexota bacterium]
MARKVRSYHREGVRIAVRLRDIGQSQGQLLDEMVCRRGAGTVVKLNAANVAELARSVGTF